MSSGIKINQNFSGYTRQGGMKRNLSVPNELRDVLTPFKEEIERLSKDQDGLIEHTKKVAIQQNSQRDDIERGGRNLLNASQATAIVASSPSSGGTVAVDNQRTVTKFLLANVQSTENFDAPSQLIGVPICYAYSDGMTSPQVLPPDQGTLSLN